MQFTLIHSEDELRKVYDDYGWQSTIVYLYLAYLYLRKRDQISRVLEDSTIGVKERDLGLEEKSFRIVTYLYLYALKDETGKNPWSWRD